MPVRATFHNTSFDIKCSKCKRTQDPIYHTQHGNVYKTCNACRDRARTQRGIQLRNNLSPEFSAHLARVPPMSTRTIIIPPDTDTEISSDDDDAVLALSSSAAAACSSSSSAGYFVDEPDPEPEPEGP